MKTLKRMHTFMPNSQSKRYCSKDIIFIYHQYLFENKDNILFYYLDLLVYAVKSSDMDRNLPKNSINMSKYTIAEGENNSESNEEYIPLAKELGPFMDTIRIDDMINHILDPYLESSMPYETIDSKEIIDAFDTASDSIKSIFKRIEREDSTRNMATMSSIDIYSRIKYITDIINDIFRDFNKLEIKASIAMDNRSDSAMLNSQDLIENAPISNEDSNIHSTSINDMSNHVVHTREYLDKLKRESERARELRSLIRYFDDFYKGRTDRLDPLVHSDTLGDLLQAADVLKKLNQTVMSSSLKGFDTAIQAIQTYTESFEQQILKEFQEACQEKNDTKMSSCSKILSSLNGGRSYIQAYVQSHEFFKNVLSADQINSIYQSSIKESVDVSSSPVLDPSIEKLYREIRRTCHNTWTSIVSLFDQPHTLMVKIVQKIFMEPVQIHIETILAQAKHHSQLAYSQALHACYISTKELLSDIQAVFESHHRRLSMYLEDLFSSYLEHNKYIQSEASNMKHLIHVLLGGWNNALSYEQLDIEQPIHHHKVLLSLLKQHDSLWPEVPDSSLYLINEQSLALKESLQDKSFDNYDDPIDHLLFNKKILSYSIEIFDRSISRVQVLCSNDQIPNAVLTLFSIFLHSIGEQFYLPMIQLLDASSYSITSIFSSALETSGSSTGSNFIALKLVNRVNSMIQSIQLYFQISLTRLLISSPRVFEDAMQVKNSLLSMMDSKLNHLVMKELDMMLEWIRMQLDKQSLSDYRPKKTDLDNVKGNSTTCNTICHFLTNLPSYILSNLDGDNASTFVDEFCMKSFSLLMDHIRRFVINESGAVLLNKDIAKYQEVMRLFQNDKVNLYFDIAREISKLFLIQSNNLKALLLEGKALQYHHHQISTPSLYTFIICREDFKSANLEEGFVVKTHYQSQIAKIFQ